MKLYKQISELKNSYKGESLLKSGENTNNGLYSVIYRIIIFQESCFQAALQIQVLKVRP